MLNPAGRKPGTEVGSFFVKGHQAAKPGFFGWDYVSSMPIFGIMFPIFRALLLLQRCRQEEDLAPYIVTNRAGDGLECRPLRWVSSGTIGLSSSGASPKKTLYGTICDLLPCLLVIAGTGGWRYKTGGFDVLDDPQGFTSGTRLRTVSGLLESDP